MVLGDWKKSGFLIISLSTVKICQFKFFDLTLELSSNKICIEVAIYTLKSQWKHLSNYLIF